MSLNDLYEPRIDVFLVAVLLSLAASHVELPSGGIMYIWLAEVFGEHRFDTPSPGNFPSGVHTYTDDSLSQLRETGLPDGPSRNGFRVCRSILSAISLILSTQGMGDSRLPTRLHGRRGKLLYV